MKFRTTAAFVKQNADAVKVQYCAMEDLLWNREPQAYVAGEDGWHADIYLFAGKAIVTGYQPFGRKARLSWEELRDYERRAHQVHQDATRSYEDRVAEVKALLAEVVEKL